MCKKALRELEKQCPTCRTDLSLLVDYATNLNEGLVQAEALTRAGELDQAVWAYLQVLEVEPDNTIARRQVGRVATAVRQFDQTSYKHWRRRLKLNPSWWIPWVVIGAMFLLALMALGGGYWWGYATGLNDRPANLPGVMADE
jgi:hypothetical protein